MKIIDRPLYINQLLRVQNTPEIKIITGIRRSGKSKLLSIFSQHIKSADPDANIINIDLTKIRMPIRNYCWQGLIMKRRILKEYT